MCWLDIFVQAVSLNFMKHWNRLKRLGRLVGLSVDKFTVKIIDHAKQEEITTGLSSNEGKAVLIEEVKTEFEQTDTSSEIEKGVRIFIDWLKSGKLEMRMYTEAPIHAKVYIMRKDPVKVPDMFGSVITGSSNFSEAGLVNNLEFNVELKDAPDVQFALNRFEILWEKGVDIRETYIEAVEENTWMKDVLLRISFILKPYMNSSRKKSMQIRKALKHFFLRIICDFNIKLMPLLRHAKS